MTTGMSPETQAAVDALGAAANGVERAASLLLEALSEADRLGEYVWPSDIDIVKARYLEQIPYALRFAAGQLLPPITGTLNISLDDATIKNGGG